MLLINSSPKNALKIFQPFLPIYVPVGIGYLIAALNEKGIKADFIDEQLDKDVIKKIEQYVQNTEPPYIFGFSVLTAAYRSAIELSQKIKKLYPDSVIIFGGIHPTASPDEVLSFDHIDLVVRGEGEIVLPELYNCLKSRNDFKHIDSLSFRDNGKIIHNKKSSIITNLDDLPKFPYHIFSEKKGYDLGFIVSSRGCPYECIFCSNRVTTDKRYRYRSAESVAEDLEMLYKKYNKRFVIFLDDNFLVNKKRVYSLVDEIKKRDLHKNMTFSFQARGDNANEELLKEIYKYGFKSIFFGIESSNDRLLKIIKKGETLDEIVTAVKMSKKIGFHVSATFIYSLPTETHSDRMGCVQLSKELDLDMVRFNNATPYPGTELYEMAKKENRLNILGMYDNFNSVSTFIENPFNKILFSYVPEGTSENVIRKDILFSYLAFYFNIHKLKPIFAKPEQGAGWFNAGEKIWKLLLKIPALFLLFFMLVIKYTELSLSILFQVNTTITRKEFGGIFKNFFKK